MAKYGVDNFSFEIIEQINNSMLNEREQYWIQYYNCITPIGYNMTSGGEGSLGYSRLQSLEEREKRRKSNIKYWEEHPEARARASQQTKDRLENNKEEKEKLIKQLKNFHETHPGYFAGENNPMYGKKHTPEALAKMRECSNARKTKIAQLNKDTLEIIQIFDGIKDAEKALGVSHGWLSKAAKNDKIAYGYKWKIIEEV